MRKTVKTLVASLALAAQLVTFGALSAGSANAAVGPGEDRQQATPSSWWTYTGVSASTVGNLLSANHARLTDIKVESSTPTFTVTMVSNSGSYGTAWWWYYGLAPSQVVTQARALGARPTVAQCYNVSGVGVRCATIMIANTGANAEPWSFWYGSPAFIGSKVVAGTRMVSFGRVQGTGLYTAVLGSNTGSDATSWWYYYGQSVASINSLVSAHHARIVDLDRNNDTGTFNVLMYGNPSGTPWYWYVNSNLSVAVNRALQQGQRIFDVTPYYIGSTKYWAVVSVNNLNSLSLRLRNIIAPTVDSGAYGFYLKQVGGATLAGLQNGKQYEPASALKVLYHAESIHQESLGNSHDSDAITYHFDPAAPNNQGICPDNFANTATTNLKNADQQMMWNSDNRMTRGILEKYTKAATLSYGSSLGLTATAINHNIGCPTAATHNRTTLTDLGKVYEAYQNGVITNNLTWQSEFRSRMLNQSNFSGFRNSICPIVNQEAASLGKSAAVATSFCNSMTWIAKGGSYQYGGALPYTVSWDGASLTSVPFKSGGVLVPRSYVFGEFVDGTQINSTTEANNINTARGKLFQEALRPYLRSALTTW